ncbi:MAG: DUF1850 domain-containing protein [Negativicutes bacterium]
MIATTCRVFVAVIMLVLFAGCMNGDRLVIESPGQEKYSVLLGKSRDFSLKYVHSVERTPVIETFYIREDGKLVLTSTFYRSYGVGLPSLPEEGKFSITADGWFRLENLNREFQDIRIRIGHEAKHILLYEKMEYPLFEWYPSGSLVIIQQGFQ